jgi:hypothetical protein
MCCPVALWYVVVCSMTTPCPDAAACPTQFIDLVLSAIVADPMVPDGPYAAMVVLRMLHEDLGPPCDGRFQMQLCPAG